MTKKNSILEGATYVNIEPLHEEHYQIKITSAEYDSGKTEGNFKKVEDMISTAKPLQGAWYKFKSPAAGISLTFAVGDIEFDLQSDNNNYDPFYGTLTEKGKSLGKFTFRKADSNVQFGSD
jgi:hypothetical protein